jgi:hypothetical protein
MTTAQIAERRAPPTSAELAERLEAARIDLTEAERLLAEAQTAAAVDASKSTLDMEAKAHIAHDASKVVVDRLAAALGATTKREAKEAEEARLYSLRVEDLAFTEALDKCDRAASTLQGVIGQYADAIDAYAQAASAVQTKVALLASRVRTDHQLQTLARALPLELRRATRGVLTLPGAATLTVGDISAIIPLADDVLSHTGSWRDDVKRAAARREGRTVPAADPTPATAPTPAHDQDAAPSSRTQHADAEAWA